jgi:hypothetical protein
MGSTITVLLPSIRVTWDREDRSWLAEAAPDDGREPDYNESGATIDAALANLAAALYRDLLQMQKDRI